MKYKVTLENFYSKHKASPWLGFQPELIVTSEDDISWWTAVDFIECSGIKDFQLLSTISDNEREDRKVELKDLEYEYNREIRDSYREDI